MNCCKHGIGRKGTCLVYLLRLYACVLFDTLYIFTFVQVGHYELWWTSDNARLGTTIKYGKRMEEEMVRSSWKKSWGARSP